MLAAYDERPDSEMIEGPWEKIISKGKNYHDIRIHGHKKQLHVYRQFVTQVCNEWENVKELCVSAKQFEEHLKKVIDM